MSVPWVWVDPLWPSIPNVPSSATPHVSHLLPPGLTTCSDMWPWPRPAREEVPAAGDSCSHRHCWPLANRTEAFYGWFGAFLHGALLCHSVTTSRCHVVRIDRNNPLTLSPRWQCDEMNSGQTGRQENTFTHRLPAGSCYLPICKWHF